ncbi:Hvo_1808 family surface protein [Natronomonas sp. EA1]|uniref:Hvo_1808 family surface protein n=1 Tax=Natronomonas sp. EA1 TaxID=3421655 RepID=UPI003EB72357
MRRALVLALLLVTAGCADLVGFGPREPPDDDTLGWEDGYWYDSPLNVTTEDGLTEAEREAVVARTMARVEVIRDLEFEESVPVSVITRAAYRERRTGRSSDPTYEAWNNQVWEALLLVGEDRNVSQVFDTVFGSSVQGFYSPANDEIVIVSDSETPQIDRGTLAHELTHALQDQHFSLGAGAATQDAQLAEDGLIEGDANAVQDEYEARCADDWDCLPRPERSGGGAPADFNMGVFLTVFTPYAEGPAFIEELRDRSGGDWDQVDRAYDDFPASTEQVIHPERYPDDEPVEVTVRNRASDGWERFDVDPVADTVGEASVYAMFWANGGIDRERSPYNYSHPLSDGWAGDSLVPYTNGSHGGYVWKLTFESNDDAREFTRAYERVLRDRGATEVADGVYDLASGPFADAFEVTRHGNTVVIVNGPSREALSKIHG